MRISSSKNNLRQKYTDAQLEEDALKYNMEGRKAKKALLLAV